MFPETLLDCLWHTTSVVRFKGIVTSTAIVPEPNIPDSERWGTSKGIKYFPFVRVIGGVSLFDFTAFDPKHILKNTQYLLGLVLYQIKLNGKMQFGLKLIVLL